MPCAPKLRLLRTHRSQSAVTVCCRQASGIGVGVGVGEGVAVGVGVRDGIAVLVEVCVGVLVGVAVADVEGVGDGVDVGEGVAVPVAVADWLAVAVEVEVEAGSAPVALSAARRGTIACLVSGVAWPASGPLDASAKPSVNTPITTPATDMRIGKALDRLMRYSDCPLFAQSKAFTASRAVVLACRGVESVISHAAVRHPIRPE